MLTPTPPSIINAKCNDGFCNQLRMLLAGILLVRDGCIKEYNQEWTITNHNNINFLDFYDEPQFITLKSISQVDINWTDGCFAGMTGKYIDKNGQKWAKNLKDVFKSLRLKPTVQQIIDNYLQDIDIENHIGVHARRTCKIGGNKHFNRTNLLLTNQQFLDIVEDYKLKVFVATDNKQTQDYFKKHLKDRFVAYNDIAAGSENHSSNEYIRENVARFTGALHTIVDFYTLLKCKRFIGTETSSFSSLIYHIRGNANDYKITSNG